MVERPDWGPGGETRSLVPVPNGRDAVATPAAPSGLRGDWGDGGHRSYFANSSLVSTPARKGNSAIDAELGQIEQIMRTDRRLYFRDFANRYAELLALREGKVRLADPETQSILDEMNEHESVTGPDDDDEFEAEVDTEFESTVAEWLGPNGFALAEQTSASLFDAAGFTAAESKAFAERAAEWLPLDVRVRCLKALADAPVGVDLADVVRLVQAMLFDEAAAGLSTWDDVVDAELEIADWLAAIPPHQRRALCWRVQ